MIYKKEKFLKIIKQNFPNLSWESSKQITRGYDHYVIILDNKIVFRFPKKADSKILLKGEILLLKFLKKYISVSLPTYSFVARDYLWAGYPMIKGQDLDSKTYDMLSHFQKNKLAKQIARFLTELHAVPIKKVRDYNIRERFASQELKQLHKNAKKYLYPNFSRQKEINIFEAFFLDLTKVFNNKYQKVLVHGDFSGDNMVFDSKYNLIGVIDFSDRAIHDPAFDFVYLWQFGQELVEAVCKYYNGDKLGILERSKVYAQASSVWNMIVAVKQKTPEYNIWYRRFKKINS